MEKKSNLKGLLILVALIATLFGIFVLYEAKQNYIIYQNTYKGVLLELQTDPSWKEPQVYCEEHFNTPTIEESVIQSATIAAFIDTGWSVVIENDPNSGFSIFTQESQEHYRICFYSPNHPIPELEPEVIG